MHARRNNINQVKSIKILRVMNVFGQDKEEKKINIRS